MTILALSPVNNKCKDRDLFVEGKLMAARRAICLFVTYGDPRTVAKAQYICSAVSSYTIINQQYGTSYYN